MLTDKQLLQILPISSIKKKYKESGQKQVILADTKLYGTQVVKIVDKLDSRVEREIEIIRNNNFKNVPKILDYNEFSCEGAKGFYIIEEYIDGITLEDLLKIKKKLPFQDVVELTKQMLEILLQLEESNIVHRDIKPANIIKSNKDGKWWLIDFGIARALNMKSLTITESKHSPHTPGYGAPELLVYSKKDIDSRADLFSLGVVIYQSSTGEHPFIDESRSVEEVWYKTIYTNPTELIFDGDTKGGFSLLIRTFMQKQLTRRPKNIQQAYRWLTNILKEENN